MCFLLQLHIHKIKTNLLKITLSTSRKYIYSMGKKTSIMELRHHTDSIICLCSNYPKGKSFLSNAVLCIGFPSNQYNMKPMHHSKILPYWGLSNMKIAEYLKRNGTKTIWPCNSQLLPLCCPNPLFSFSGSKFCLSFQKKHSWSLLTRE